MQGLQHDVGKCHPLKERFVKLVILMFYHTPLIRWCGHVEILPS